MKAVATPRKQLNNEKLETLNNKSSHSFLDEGMN